ncbi:MAG TPA: hypothetical protein VF255_06145 [Solirubrobacterales bacterium]
MHVMAREAWTDERLDDLTKHMDENFREVRAELRQQREATAAEFTVLRKEFAEVKSQGAKTDAKIDGLVRTVQIGFWLIGSFLVGLMGIFATQL